MPHKCHFQLINLIGQLDEFIEEFGTSEHSNKKTGGFLAPGAIDQEWPQIYSTIQELEPIYKEKFPIEWQEGAWRCWNDLLHHSRLSPGKYDSILAAHDSAMLLKKWAQIQLSSTNEQYEEFLGLAVNFELRTVEKESETGGAQIAKFGRKEQPWILFLKLMKAGSDGVTTDELLEEIWSPTATRDNLDKCKQRTNDVLQSIRIEIHANGRGVWKLQKIV